MVLSLFRRAVQSFRLARMGLKINRAEAQRAQAKINQHAANVSVASGSGLAGASKQAAMTPEQLQQRIRELRAALVQSSAQANVNSMQQMQDDMATNMVQSAASTIPSGSTVGSATAESEMLAQQQLQAFNERLDALTAAKQESFVRSLAASSLKNIEAVGSFGGQMAPIPQEGGAPAAEEADEDAAAVTKKN